MSINELCEKYKLRTGATFGLPGINPSIVVENPLNGNSVTLNTHPTPFNTWDGEIKGQVDLLDGQKKKLAV